MFFPECVAVGSHFTLGVDLCFLDAAIVSATVRGTTAAGTLWPCLWGAAKAVRNVVSCGRHGTS